MNPENKMLTQGKSNEFVHLFKKLAGKISSLFKAEEVEVTFKGEGKNMSYTYKVTHK